MDNASRLTFCDCQQKYYSAKPPKLLLITDIDPITGEQKKKKANIVPKVTLISGDELTVTTLEEAQKISKRRNLKLVKIVDLDTKTQRPVYKLMTGSEYQAEDLKQREQRKKEKQNSFIKGEKVLILNQRISEHDLQTDIKKIKKWIAKSYEVRVVINGDSNSMQKAVSVYL
ncbi:hypothetical protein NQ314_012144 [Rhamnusium bicolor]|uniref:Translation initiation factor 3 N-terminal domain-containing protein n=1 Tax=Rhamnusium bicolor TaxID=1586634 RepID=A0AAV8XDW4_9CUCU|nr:hypothetical protein NQ314_012144 [Rhamnusium bicolor]